MLEYKKGDKVRMKEAAKDLVYWRPVPEFYVVRDTHNEDSGGVSLLVENPDRPKGSFMSREWHNSCHFVSA
jgi:hypothetical protein